MDEKMRNSETENNDNDNPQKASRKRRTPSGSPNRSETRRRRSPSRSISHSPVRERRRRQHSRSRSPDRRFDRRFNRGGYRGDFRRNRSPSPDYRRNRNRNTRRSRSSSYDRFRNRRNMSTSRDRSMSRGDSRQPNFQNEYGSGPTGGQPYPAAEYPPGYPNPTNYPNQAYQNYDYQVPMQQVPVPNSYLPTFSAPPPPVIGDYNNQNVQYQVPPPPVISEPPQPIEADEEKQKREAAIALEKQHQRETLRKQRDEYVRRAAALKKELITLKEQKEELSSGHDRPSPTTSGFLDENDRLQAQIQNKIRSIENVIDMLDGIIDSDKSETQRKKSSETQPDNKSDDSSPERLKTKVIESLSRKRKDSDRVRVEEKPKSAPKEEEHVNYTFYDPEQHWCKACASFPKTAKEFLGHLHSEEHKNNVKPPEIPWHNHLVNDDMPTYQNAPTKRIPIRGLQFFVPSVAWYCKLCSIWIGDLHCASSHLKSKTHAREFDKFIQKNPTYETDWMREREQAFNQKQSQTIAKNEMIPPPPVISSKSQTATAVPPPPSSSYVNTTTVFDSIPLQINQRAKEVLPPAPSIVTENSSDKKKGKKKKKDKKKKSKKSKKKHRRSSSSSSSSSSDGSSESETEPEQKQSAVEQPQQPPSAPGPVPPIQPPIDTSTSIRVAMRNATKTHLKPKSDDESETPGGWTVVQEAKPVAPLPPTISANGEAQNRRDDMLINQWNAPTPVISEKEKQLLEQLKGKLKNREDKKQEKPSQSTNIEQSSLPQSRSNDEPSRRNEEKRDDKRDDRRDDRRDDKRRDDRDRRDTQRRRRSTSSPRRDRRSRSPRRDRRRRSRSRSVSLRRDRRSRSPRRDRRRRSPTRSRSRDRRDSRQESKFNPPDRRNKEKERENDRKKTDNDKSNSKKSSSSSSASTTATTSTKKLPFIGRMPVLKKQTTEEETKKPDVPNDGLSEEERLIRQKKQEELKFHLQQTKQLLHQQQKQAEAFNLAHPGQIDQIYHQHGSIHHVLPHVQEEYEDLMPDPMHYAMISTAPPPPPTETGNDAAQQIQSTQQRFEEQEEEPVLPPGIEEEEIESEVVVPNVPAQDVLPEDFQTALSIIFDKDQAAKQNDNKTVPTNNNTTTTVESSEIVTHDENSTYVAMDIVEDHMEIVDPNQAAMGVIDEQSQYMLYSGLTENNFYGDLAAHIPQGVPPPIVDPSIPMPGSTVLDNNAIANTNDNNGNGEQASANIDEINAKNKRLQELDDLAMLGIDAEDLAAQCI